MILTGSRGQGLPELLSSYWSLEGEPFSAFPTHSLEISLRSSDPSEVPFLRAQLSAKSRILQFPEGTEVSSPDGRATTPSILIHLIKSTVR